MARSNTGSTANWLQSASAPFTAVPYTLTCWFYPANLTAAMNLAFAGSTTSNEYAGLVFDGSNAYALGDNRLVFDAFGAGINRVFATTTAVAAATTWNHACAVAASTTSRAVYLNGGGKATQATSVVPGAHTRLQVGVYRPGATSFSPLNGSIAEVAAWSAALTDAEVLSLARGLSPLLVRPNNLVAYWPIIGVTSPERCLVSTNTLAITGTMAKAAHVNVPLFGPQPPIIGVPTEGGTNYTLTGGLTAAALPITGAIVVPRTAKTIAVTPGALPIAGATVTPRYGRAATITAGALPIAGQVKSIVHGRRIIITAGALPIAGATVTPRYGRSVTISAGALPVVGQSIAPLTARQITVTAAPLPISGQSITTVFSAGGINYSTTITPAALPVLGAIVTPSTARQIAVAAAALPIVGGSIVPVFAPGSLAYGITITPAALAIVGGSLAMDFSGVVEVFARRSLAGTFQPAATLSGVFDPTAQISGIITPPPFP